MRISSPVEAVIRHESAEEIGIALFDITRAVKNFGGMKMTGKA